MVIDGIEYKMMVMMSEENGELFHEVLFDDFDGFNRFVKDPGKGKFHTGTQAFYSLVEVGSNGKTDRPLWEFPIALQEIRPDQADRLVREFQELNEDIQNTFQLDDSPEYCDEDRFLQENKQKHMKDVVYVCPHCFRPVQECICAKDPKILIQIDTLMMDVLQQLNDKGYHTRISCAGHMYDPELLDNGVYIAFFENYDFNVPFPEGSVYFKGSHLLRICPDDLNGFEQWQKETIEKLRQWAQALDDQSKTD